MWISDDDVLITNAQIPIALDIFFTYSPGLTYDCGERERRAYTDKVNPEMTEDAKHCRDSVSTILQNWSKQEKILYPLGHISYPHEFEG